MPKRKQTDTDGVDGTPTKRNRKSRHSEPESDPERDETQLSPTKKVHKAGAGVATTSLGRKKTKASMIDENDEGDTSDQDQATPRANGRKLFSTPSRRTLTNGETPSKSKRADQSAKRKSARVLAERDENEEDWDGEEALAHAILEDGDARDSGTTDREVAIAETPFANTPSKRGRPKGARNKRSPTPEGDLPPEERYFFQNRSGPVQASTNSMSSVKLLTHEEYFDVMKEYKDHEVERTHLEKLYARSFPQWQLELDEGYNLCLYGYGSKRKLVQRFAHWIAKKRGPLGRVVVLNGYVSKLSIKTFLGTIAASLLSEDEELKLSGPPFDMLDTLFSFLSEKNLDGKILILINSVDGAALRRSNMQSLLAKLATNPYIQIVATADTPSFSLLWNSSLQDQFNFLYHDCTTLSPYDVEINVVDDVHELFGRRGRRVGGKEGISYVLKSLPENARNLYRVLLAEILAVLSDGIDGGGMGDEDGDYEFESGRKNTKDAAEDVGIEYRPLYQKASEEFICSSDINFRFLLKEFHDHQMITSRRDTAGTEMFGIPLGKDEMESVLEELIG